MLAQVVLVMQLVLQVSLKPFLEPKFDVASDSGVLADDAAWIRCIIMLMQVETVLTVGLVMLTFCGMVRDGFPSMPGSASRWFWLQAQVVLAQAFSLGTFLPDLAKDGAAYMVVTVCAWVTISVGIGLTVMGLMNEASLSAAFVF